MNYAKLIVKTKQKKIYEKKLNWKVKSYKILQINSKLKSKNI